MKLLKKIDDILSKEENSFFENLPKKNQEELLTIKIDITYTYEEDDDEKNNHIFKVLEFVSSSKSTYPWLKNMVVLFKKMTDSHRLNDSWHGGLSSYCLFLLVLATFQFIEASKYKFNNVAEAFAFILSFYSMFYNFSNSYINFVLSNPFCVGHALETIPVILDPLTQSNAAKTCYKIIEVQEELKRINYFIAQKKEQFDLTYQSLVRKAELIAEKPKEVLKEKDKEKDKDKDFLDKGESIYVTSCSSKNTSSMEVPEIKTTSTNLTNEAESISINLNNSELEKIISNLISEILISEKKN